MGQLVGGVADEKTEGTVGFGALKASGMSLAGAVAELEVRETGGRGRGPQVRVGRERRELEGEE